MENIFTTKDGYNIYDENELLWDTHDYDSNSPAILSNPRFLSKTEAKYAKNLKRSFFKFKENAIKYQSLFIKGISLNNLLENNKSTDDLLVLIEKSKLIEVINNYVYELEQR